MELPESYTLKARWIFPVESPPLINAIVVVERGRIVDLGMHDPPANLPLFGMRAAILPGLVNAHTHLEFSDLAAPLGRPGMPLTEWLPLGMKLREQANRPPLAQRVSEGIAQCAAGGATLVGEIATTPWDPPPLEAAEDTKDEPARPQVVAFAELIAPIEDRVGGALELAQRQLAAGEAGIERGWQAGLSPHAPYTACRELLTRAAELAAQHNVPLAIHLAESPEEIEWLAGRGGPIADLLASRGAPPELALPPGQSAAEVLKLLKPAPRVLIVHGNYLEKAAIDLLAAEPDRLTVVLCPRTHTYFGHTPHPVEKLLKRGASVALGTDGRGSNPDLSMLAEMRHLRRKHAGIPAAKILELGTLAGAQALGCAEERGSLAIGKRADFCIVEVPPFKREKFPPESPKGAAPHAAEALENLLTGDEPVLATIVNGRAIYEHTGRK